jgi:hypothetical protein
MRRLVQHPRDRAADTGEALGWAGIAEAEGRECKDLDKTIPLGLYSSCGMGG